MKMKWIFLWNATSSCALLFGVLEDAVGIKKASGLSALSEGHCPMDELRIPQRLARFESQPRTSDLITSASREKERHFAYH
jgi:hypothetical protein